MEIVQFAVAYCIRYQERCESTIKKVIFERKRERKEKNKQVIYELRVGPYSEKLCPRSGKKFSRPRSRLFFAIRTSQLANNIDIFTCEDIMFSRDSHLVFHWCLHNKVNYLPRSCHVLSALPYHDF